MWAVFRTSENLSESAITGYGEIIHKGSRYYNEIIIFACSPFADEESLFYAIYVRTGSRFRRFQEITMFHFLYIRLIMFTQLILNETLA